MSANRIAVMASGKGSNLKAILQAAERGECPVNVQLVISDKADAPALKVAKDAGVADVLFLNPKEYPDRAAFDAACAEAIEQAGCQWIVLAGYMRILSGEFIARFRNCIINIHPALLPSFPGAHAVRDALAYGAKITGVTVHLVDEVVDGGPILAQFSVPVQSDDTEESLHNRIHAAEHQLYPEILKRMIEGKFSIEDRRAVWKET
ncbi:MAG: phosphoribosylglycinamide formyltransferase [Mariprofundaceae bacterium]|nr:phosphoribosylglycinamide formyltransferase [Mariprofundaceae bacterium]